MELCIAKGITTVRLCYIFLPEICRINRILLSYIKIFQLQTIMHKLSQKPTDFLVVVVIIGTES